MSNKEFSDFSEPESGKTAFRFFERNLIFFASDEFVFEFIFFIFQPVWIQFPVLSFHKSNGRIASHKSVSVKTGSCFQQQCWKKSCSVHLPLESVLSLLDWYAFRTWHDVLFPQLNSLRRRSFLRFHHVILFYKSEGFNTSLCFLFCPFLIASLV